MVYAGVFAAIPLLLNVEKSQVLNDWKAI